MAAPATAAAVVYLLPVLAVVMAGPAGFAVCAVWAWAGSRAVAQETLD